MSDQNITERYCGFCEKPLPDLSKPQRKYCNAVCRASAGKERWRAEREFGRQALKASAEANGTPVLDPTPDPKTHQSRRRPSGKDMEFAVLHLAPMTSDERSAAAEATDGRDPRDPSKLPDQLPAGPIAMSTMRALRDARVLETPLGMATFKIALRLDNSNLENGSAVARMTTELAKLLEKAIGSAKKSSSDPIDELMKRREQRRGNAG